MDNKDIIRARDLTIENFKGITPSEEQIWMKTLDDRIESAKLVKTWVIRAIKAAKKSENQCNVSN